MSDDSSLRSSPLGVATALFAVTIVLALLSVAGHAVQYLYGTGRLAHFVRLFNLSGEGNIPTWFSAIVLFSCAAQLWGIAEDERRHGERRFRTHWRILALGFLYISLDEVAQLHELSIQPLRERFQLRGPLYEGWVVPAILIVLLFLVAYRRFLIHLSPSLRRLFIVSGTVYLSGALGMELVGGVLVDYHADETILRGAVATLEELLELSGIILFLYALLVHRAAT
jgi:hypothetical protein